MKKLLLNLLLLIPVIVFAQEKEKTGSFKIKAGLNYSFISGDIKTTTSQGSSFYAQSYENGNYEKYTEPKQGIYIGIGYVINMGDKINFTPELVFNQYGAKEKYAYKRSDRKDDFYTLNYLSIPIMFDYKIASKFNIGFGPQMNFLLNPKSAYEYLGVDNVSNDLDDLYSKVNVGLNANASYNIDENISIDLRYHFGVTSSGNNIEVRDNSRLTVFEIDNKSYNKSIQLGLSYKF